MFDCSKLIEQNYNPRRRASVKYSREDGAVIYLKCVNFDGPQFRNLLSDICYVIRVYGKACKKIVIAMPKFYPTDKMVYILLESVIYTLIFIYGYEVDFLVEEYKYNINSAGLMDSALFRMVKDGLNRDVFEKEFYSNLAKNHFRKIVKNNEDDTAVSLLVTEIKTFMYRFHAKEDFDKEFAYMVGELVDNAFGHVQTECLVDIDISTCDFEYLDDDSGKKYYAVNLCIMNLGDKCIYDDIRSKILDRQYADSERYDMVQAAYEKHCQFFNRSYNDEKFFMISSFQDEISGRPNETTTGGTGLPELVRNLEEYASDDYCYVISGHEILLFKKNYLNYTSHGWIGFNKENDFVNQKPDGEVFLKSETYVPGTGYNFMLAFEGGQS